MSGRYIGQSWQDDRNPGGPLASIIILTIGIVVGITIMVLAKGCSVKPMPAVVAQAGCNECHTPSREKMTAYFRKAGSRSPEEMANAVVRTRNGRLLAAIAVVESGGNPTVRRSGYKKRHDGAFQVNKKYWGKVPHDAAGQALQAEAILAELTETMPIKKALALYGGDSTDKYTKRVLAELVRVP